MTTDALAEHPYRAVPSRGAVADGDGALFVLDVSGARGSDGLPGADGRPGEAHGESGEPGSDAGPATAGQDAGQIHVTVSGGADGVFTLRGEIRLASGATEEVDATRFTGETGSVVLRAVGGDGGRGGNGGDGGDGASGRDGRDATRWSSGTSGGDGGDGGEGGDATSGAPGGRGGDVVVSVAAAETSLLMLVEHAEGGGGGGAAGTNGDGGDGGRGGSGGSSYSWSESDGDNNQTHRFNPGGFNGSAGPGGRPGRADVTAGADGASGSFQIRVLGERGAEAATYRGRYDLRLCHFVHADTLDDGVYEPGEEIVLRALRVENVGAMPLPPAGQVELRLAPARWHEASTTALAVPGGVAAAEVITLDGDLRTRLADHPPTRGAPLFVVQDLAVEAWVPSVRRRFERFADSAQSLGTIHVRWPLQIEEPQYLRGLASGEATRLRIPVTSTTPRSLGRTTPDGRVVRVRVQTAADSELGDDHVALYVDGHVIRPSTGWLHEIDQLGPTAAMTIELDVTIRPEAPSYREWRGEVTLELSHVYEPASIRPIQVRAVGVRVAERFAPESADLLLVVNHRTPRDAVDAWIAMARQIMARVTLWDLSREHHLDLDRPVHEGRSLAELFAGKAMVVLDNWFDGPSGDVCASEFLCPDQLRRAANAGLDVAFIGGTGDLREHLIPTAAADERTALATTVEETAIALRHRSLARMGVWRTRWWPWGPPSPAVLVRQAHALSRRLHHALPGQRHIVVHHYEPRLIAKGWISRSWFVGTLETRRTLDAAAASIVHAEVFDFTVNDPATILTGLTRLAVLAMLDVEQQLERLRWVLASAAPDHAVVADLCAALLAALSGEIAVAVTGGSRLPDELSQLLPRLAIVASRPGSAALTSPIGEALCDFAGAVWHVARCQVRWYERLPPVSWTARSCKVRDHVRAELERWAAAVFGADAAAPAWRRIEARADAHRLEMRPRRFWWVSRRARALAHGQRLLETHGLNADTEILATPHDRVLDAAAAAELATAAERAATYRARIMQEGAAARDTLSVVRRHAGHASREVGSAAEPSDQAGPGEVAP